MGKLIAAQQKAIEIINAGGGGYITRFGSPATGWFGFGKELTMYTRSTKGRGIVDVTIRAMIEHGVLTEWLMYTNDDGRTDTTYQLAPAYRQPVAALPDNGSTEAEHDAAAVEAETPAFESDEYVFDCEHGIWGHITQIKRDEFGDTEYHVLTALGNVYHCYAVDLRAASSDEGTGGDEPDTASAAVEQLAAAEAEQSEVYEYGFRNRPAIEAAPSGWFDWRAATGERLDRMHGTAKYSRALTHQEMTDYELFPVSINAYDFQVGALVMDDADDGYTVTGHDDGWYTLALKADPAYTKSARWNKVVAAVEPDTASAADVTAAIDTVIASDLPFAVGDRVEVIVSTLAPFTSEHLGKVGTVTDVVVYYPLPYQVAFQDGTQTSFAAAALRKLDTPTPDPRDAEIAPGDKVMVIDEESQWCMVQGTVGDIINGKAWIVCEIYNGITVRPDQLLKLDTAANLTTALRMVTDATTATIDGMSIEIARLRVALKPFADIKCYADGENPIEYLYRTDDDESMTALIKAAREALG